jgi:hypothetical protein
VHGLNLPGGVVGNGERRKIKGGLMVGFVNSTYVLHLRLNDGERRWFSVNPHTQMRLDTFVYGQSRVTCFLTEGVLRMLLKENNY